VGFRPTEPRLAWPRGSPHWAAFSGLVRGSGEAAGRLYILIFKRRRFCQISGQLAESATGG
jgi:hypothetical protein